MKLLLLALGICFFSACRPAATPASKKLNVLTSILPVYCLTASVAGDLAEIETLLAAGVDAHDFQFTPRERRQFDRADLIVINGLGMETWLDRVLQQSGGLKTVVHCAAGLGPHLIVGMACLDPDHGATNVAGGDSGPPSAPNPHIWLDPSLAMAMVTNILVALQKADPTNAAGYAANAGACIVRLRQLDDEIRNGLASLTHRHIVTQHDAFPYFARRYGLRIAGVIEESPDVAPTAKHLVSLKQSIETNRVVALFTEPGHSAKLARQFAADLNLRVASLDTLETGEVKPAAYEDGMRRNLRSLQDALK